MAVGLDLQAAMQVIQDKIEISLPPLVFVSLGLQQLLGLFPHSSSTQKSLGSGFGFSSWGFFHTVHLYNSVWVQGSVSFLGAFST